MAKALYTLQEFNLHDGDHEYTLNLIFKTKDHLRWTDKILIEKMFGGKATQDEDKYETWWTSDDRMCSLGHHHLISANTKKLLNRLGIY
jgi:hypothetical protein|tara:strand:- start:744 stop:1010 length:267 start_codon:yes stop_codon:yes gene_type:complete